jgi:hypothetical protein
VLKIDSKLFSAVQNLKAREYRNQQDILGNVQFYFQHVLGYI